MMTLEHEIEDPHAPEEPQPGSKGKESQVNDWPPEARLVRQRLQTLLAGGGITQAQISRECGDGVSVGTLSAFLSGKYTGNRPAVTRRLEQWLTLRDEKGKTLGWLSHAPGFVETPSTARVLAACAYAHQTCDIALIYGGAGVSKTESLKEYTRRSRGVWRVEMTSAHGRLVAALERVLYAMGATGHLTQRGYALHDGIVRRAQGTGGLLIIDEAQHLDVQTLDALRAIHDQAQIGLVLSGNRTVHQRMTGGVRQAEFAQLFSRLGMKVRIDLPVAGDINAVLDAWKVKGKPERDYLRAIAARPGALRVLTKLLNLASVYAEGKPLDLSALMHADKTLEEGS